MENYRRLWNQIREMGLRIEIDPLIRVIQISGEQFNTFRELAERRLRERVEEAIVRLQRIYNEIHEITEEEKRRNIRRRLSAERREWVEIEQIARRLGINLSGDFSRVIELIDEALGGL
jgi:Rad3-related DNA helicase